MEWGNFLENIANLVEITAIAVGGVWVYYHFIKGRIYKPRLEADVSGKLISGCGEKYLIATARLKNLGLSNVKLEQKGSGLRVFAIYVQRDKTDPCSEIETTEKRLFTFPVFQHHKWIESGEPISDQRFIPLPPKDQVAIKLELRVVARKISWRAIQIIDY
jgi:hypothetical protein